MTGFTPYRLIARLSSAAAVTLVLLSGLAAHPSVAAADERSAWMVPYPFGTNQASPVLSKTYYSGPTRFTAVGPMGSSHRFSGLKWKDWGTSKATARGRGRYCDGTCERWKTVSITLSRRQKTCPEAPFTYTRYRVVGLDASLAANRHSAGVPC